MTTTNWLMMMRFCADVSGNIFWYLGLVLLMVPSQKSVAQFRQGNGTIYNVEWSQGSIMLNEGVELKGLIGYEANLEIVGCKNADGLQSLKPKDVIAFEFFDELTQKQRVFFTVEMSGSKEDSKRKYFFELMKDFKDFSILLRTFPVSVENRTGLAGALNNTSPTGYTAPSATKTTITQIEVIYFMGLSGHVEPYLQLTHKIVDAAMLDRDKIKSKVLNKHVLDKYFTPGDIAKMEKFADDNDLDFEIKEDFMKILDFCYDHRETK